MIQELNTKPAFYAKAVAFFYLHKQFRKKEPTLKQVSTGALITYDEARSAIRWLRNLQHKSAGEQLVALALEPTHPYNKNFNDSQIPDQVLRYLNEKAGRRLPNVDTNKSNIRARLREGHTMEDLLLVIDLKCQQWADNPQMKNYLRPATLFAKTHFHDYLPEAREALDEGTIGLPTQDMVDIIDFINQALGTDYSAASYEIFRRLNWWLNSGYTRDDLIRVADVMIGLYGNKPDKRYLLEPNFIYGKKFKTHAAIKATGRAEQAQRFASNLDAYKQGQSFI